MDLFSAKTWEHYDAPGVIQQRLRLLEKIIPQNVHTILDTGCGNGIITNALADRYNITGLDISAAALASVNTPKVQASVTSIPFPDKSFHLCMSNEVLEHLDAQDLSPAISELKRCASHYVLISVPNNEQLEYSHIKCADCSFAFHAYGHFQSFDLQRLDALIGLQRRKSYVLGPPMHRYQKELLSLRQRRLNQWFDPGFACPCPKCGSEKRVAEKSILTKICNGINRLFPSSSPYWLVALYEITK